MSEEVVNIQLAIQDPIVVRRIRQITIARQYPRDSRTVRELAMERLQQIENFGDVPLIPSRQVVSGTVRDHVIEPART